MFKYQTLDLHRYGVHAIVLDLIKVNKDVLDIGCATGYLAKMLNRKGCRTWGIDNDKDALSKAKKYCVEVFNHDVNKLDILKIKNKFDYILLLDVIEHLISPEICLLTLKRLIKKDGIIIISTPNIAHISIRYRLLFGRFDYEKYGILDNTHLRFYTKKSFTRLLSHSRLNIKKLYYPADFAQIPLFGRILNYIHPDIQLFLTKIMNKLLSVQFIAICNGK